MLSRVLTPVSARRSPTKTVWCAAGESSTFFQPGLIDQAETKAIAQKIFYCFPQFQITTHFKCRPGVESFEGENGGDALLPPFIQFAITLEIKIKCVAFILLRIVGLKDSLQRRQPGFDKGEEHETFVFRHHLPFQKIDHI
ncbi:MAG: hypothetical protein IH586_06445 [Anaerolineaceae bacterium]|nr:hypothetical protein [Anaerolineaceae bacterium]